MRSTTWGIAFWVYQTCNLQFRVGVGEKRKSIEQKPYQEEVVVESKELKGVPSVVSNGKKIFGGDGGSWQRYLKGAETIWMGKKKPLVWEKLKMRAIIAHCEFES